MSTKLKNIGYKVLFRLLQISDDGNRKALPSRKNGNSYEII